MHVKTNFFGKKFIAWSAWSFIGVILAGILFIWQEYRDNYGFQVEINDVFNLIEVRESIDDLKIIYQGEDIVKSKNEIKVARISIRNMGDTILQQYYDNLESFGLYFPDANILQLTIVDASTEGLKKKIMPLTGNDNAKNTPTQDMIFSKVIFEEDDFVTFKLVLMQEEGVDFSVRPLGKIANINEINVMYSKSPKEENIRLLKPIYFFAATASILSLLIALGFVIEYKSKELKKLKLQRFKFSLPNKGKDLSIQEDYLLDYYINDWSSSKEYLLKQVLNGENITDMRGVIQQGFTNGSGSVSSLLVLKFTGTGTMIDLPKFLYTVIDNQIQLNEENKEFIINFYRSVIE